MKTYKPQEKTDGAQKKKKKSMLEELKTRSILTIRKEKESPKWNAS